MRAAGAAAQTISHSPPTNNNKQPTHKQAASETYLKGILGFEERPLVSTDYVNDAVCCVCCSLF